MLTVTINHDTDIENPCDDEGQWKLYSFLREHRSDKRADDFFTVTKKGVAFKFEHLSKARAGLIFPLEYYEHGNCRWSLRGTGSQVDRQWDVSDYAGVLVWEHPVSHIGAKTYDDRRKDASVFLDYYTDWCNGNCYYYSIEHDVDGHVDSCGGFIGEEYIVDCINQAIKHYSTDEEIKVNGACNWIVSRGSIKCGTSPEEYHKRITALEVGQAI